MSKRMASTRAQIEREQQEHLKKMDSVDSWLLAIGIVGLLAIYFIF